MSTPRLHMTRRMAEPEFRDDQLSRIREPQVFAINRLCDRLSAQKADRGPE
jgi:hypothetical protein